MADPRITTDLSSQEPERWAPVFGWAPNYSVSTLGRVRSEDHLTGTAWTTSGRRCRGQLLNAGLNPGGYPQVLLTMDGFRQLRRVHTLVLETFVEPRPNGMDGCHNNGIRTDCRLSNLRWDTPSENQLDSVRHGTHHLTRRKTCPRQHPLVLPNLVPYELRKGARSCLACARARNYAFVTGKRKGVVFEPAEVAALAEKYYAELMLQAEEAS